MWCTACSKHISMCKCDYVYNIYTVEYRLTILPEAAKDEKDSIYCEESVRCIAGDIFEAMSYVTAWAKVTPIAWSKDDGKEYRIPAGKRDVRIKQAKLHTKNVGELLRIQSLPTIFQAED